MMVAAFLLLSTATLRKVLHDKETGFRVSIRDALLLVIGIIIDHHDDDCNTSTIITRHFSKLIHRLIEATRSFVSPRYRSLAF